MLNKFRELLFGEGLDAALVSSSENIFYLTCFSGFSSEEREAYLLITRNKQYVITDSRFFEAVQKHIPDFELIRVSQSLAYQAIESLIKKHKLKILGLEKNNLTIFEFEELRNLADFKHFNLTARQIKNKKEVQTITQACRMGDNVFKHILNKIKPGITEKQLAWEMEKYVKERGGEFSFQPVIAFNANAAMPHHVYTDTRLPGTNGQLILLDFGIKLNNYCSDMTRVVFLGKATLAQKKIYQAVLGAQQKALEYLSKIKEPVLGKLVDQKARDYLLRLNLPVFGHGLGHGIGLQAHEAPRLSPTSKDFLVPGNVFSVEPGIYLPGEFGIRIEDLVAIEEEKIVLLTSAPKEIIEL